MAQEVVAPIKNGAVAVATDAIRQWRCSRNSTGGCLKWSANSAGGTFINLPSSLADLETLTRRRIWSAITLLDDAKAGSL